MTRPPADQPPLFDVVMGDAVPTHHRDAREHADAHARALAACRECGGPRAAGDGPSCERCRVLWMRDARP